jgi:cytoskeleton protein RodZ
MLSLGQELKRAREERGLTLQDIAGATHIGVRFLQAIETDTYDVLPGGVFNRAFVRKFARHVGFDEEQAVKLYGEQLEEMGGEPQRRYYTGLEDIEARPSSGNGLWFSLFVLALISAGGYLAYNYFNPAEPTPEPGSSQAVLTSKPVPQASVTPEPGQSGLLASAMRMKLSAKDQRCWVRVTADTTYPDETILRPGELREYNANEKFVISLGNLPTITIIINGREVDNGKFAPNMRGVVARDVIITKDNYEQFLN